MTPDQVTLVQFSFKSVAPIAAKAADLFYDRLFEIAPEVRQLFPADLSGQKVKLIVKNENATPEEFDSKRLNREKVIPGRSQATIYIGPLKPGEYPFVGEFNESTATGKIVVK